jgi:hypothetical protein
MSEVERNLLGFTLGPEMFFASMLVLLRIGRRRWPRAGIVALFLVAPATLGLVLFWCAGLFEDPVAYYFTVLRLQRATSVNGVPISKVIPASRGSFSVDDYFAHTCGYYRNLITVRLDPNPPEHAFYYFLYENRRQVLVPINEQTAEAFPALMPKGDELVSMGVLNGTGATISFGSGEIKPPAKWFRSVTGNGSQ